MRIKPGILFIFLILILLCSNPAYAEDPGEPDTVRFEPWGTYVPCPPCSGRAVVPVVVFCDEELVFVDIPLKLEGPIAFDSGSFVGEVANFLEISGTRGQFVVGDQGENVIVVISSATSGAVLPPIEGEIIAHMFLTVNDTALGSMDTTIFSVPESNLHFLTADWGYLVPVFLESEFYIGPQDALPGDIDDNGIINLSDAIGLANYFLKGGPPPVFSGSADVNTDCQIDFSDIILIAKWYLTGQTPLKPGCAY